MGFVVSNSGAINDKNKRVKVKARSEKACKVNVCCHLYRIDLLKEGGKSVVATACGLSQKSLRLGRVMSKLIGICGCFYIIGEV